MSLSTPQMIQGRRSHADCCEIPRVIDRAWEVSQRERRVDAESDRETS